MGNTVLSSGAFVAVEIDDPGTHSGGSTVRGRVYLDVQKPSVSADSLCIRFYGREHSCVEYSETEGSGDDQRTVTNKAYETKLFYDVDYPLCSYAGKTVQNGRYEHPFEIKLPLNIPGKQKHGNQFGSFLNVDYHVEARLHRHGMLTWDVKNSMEVLMLDPPYNRIPTPVFSPPSTVPIHKYCCIRSGTITLAMKLDSNNVVESEAFRVFYEVNNQSTCRVKALSISVYRTLKCQARSKRHRTYTTVFQHRIDSSLMQNSSPLDRKDNNHLSTAPEEEIRMMVDRLAKDNQCLKVKIPALSGASFTGALGSVSYSLIVQIKTPFGVEEPRIECPIILHRSAVSFEHVVPAVEHDFTRPPDWKSMNPSAPVQFEPPRLSYVDTISYTAVSTTYGE